MCRSDRESVRRICVATAWMGEPAPRHTGDEWTWAEFWTRYFTDRDRRHSWVAARRGDGHVTGYLAGTADARRFDAYVPFLLPGIVFRAVRRRLIRRPESRRALLGLLCSLLAGELDLPAGVASDYPATFHLNLLPEARGRGLARQLLERFLGEMRRLGVAGVHAQTLSVNEPIRRFCLRAGFQRVASRPLRAFAHADPRPIDVCTWVLAL